MAYFTPIVLIFKGTEVALKFATIKKKSCSLFSRDIAFGIHWGRLNSRSINCSKQLISLITIMVTVAIRTVVGAMASW